MKNKQSDFWSGEFGKEYNVRNTFNEDEWDNFYLKTWGKTKIEMNTAFLSGLSKDIKILEVGSNIGMQLRGLQKMGFKNLYGIEIQQDAVESSKKHTVGINIIQGSGYELPFKDNYFDLVFTSGVLIHIAPDNLKVFMGEMARCSSKYIWGFEYFAPEVTDINYRGHTGFLWKADYSKLFQAYTPSLREVKREYYKYVNDENVDMMYLLEKK